MITDDDLRRFFELSQDVLCVLDRDGRVRQVNPAIADVLGWQPDEIVDTPLGELAHPDDRTVMDEHLARVSSGLTPLSFVTRCRAADRRSRDLLWTVHAPNGNGRLYASGRDVTALRRDRARWEAAVDAAPVSLVLTDGQGHILLVNRAVEDVFGYRRTDMIGRSIEILVPERLRTGHRELRSMFGRNPQARPMGRSRDLSAVRSDGTEFPVEIGLTPIKTPHETLVLAAIVDLTARHQTAEEAVRQAHALEEANAKLEEMASTDSLTRLWNRRVFLEQLGFQMQIALRTRRPLSLLLLDIDHFKRYNDSHGHLAGDAVLEQLAGILRGLARRSDYVARIGGEEFAVLLPETDSKGAVRLGERFRRGVEAAEWPIEPIKISAGATTVRFEPPETDVVGTWRSMMLSKADRALYHSKRHGRNRVTHVNDLD
jgi:diguanylate cyclase (GGDEF)-like protein/PAS domain S-box-containing protein